MQAFSVIKPYSYAKDHPDRPVVLYIVLSVSLLLLTLEISGVYISWLTLFAAITGALSFCFSAVHLLGWPQLFFHGNLRQPILEEEIRLASCLNEVLRGAGCRKKFRLRIIEVEAYDVVACNTDIIAISRSLLDRLTDEELKGVLAHELGHLLSRDTTVCRAFATASLIPELIRVHNKWKIRLMRSFGLLSIVIALLLWTFRPMWLLSLLAAVFSLLIFYVMHRLFRWLMLLVSRLTEYRQDAFAHQLGHGAGLMKALKKMADYGRERVNIYFILKKGMKPVIYNRIRKLETLEGMRD